MCVASLGPSPRHRLRPRRKLLRTDAGSQECISTAFRRVYGPAKLTQPATDAHHVPQQFPRRTFSVATTGLRRAECSFSVPFTLPFCYPMQPLPPLDDMTPAELEAFLATLAHDDGAAARGHLARNNPIYCRTASTPAGLVEKHFPDGRRQLVRFNLAGEHVVGDDVQSEGAD